MTGSNQRFNELTRKRTGVGKTRSIIFSHQKECNSEGQTALHHAAIGGSLRVAAALVKRDPSLTGVLENKGLTPLLIAARYISGSELVCYLTLTTADGNPDRPFTGPLAADLVHMLIAGDVLLHLLRQYPNSATLEGSSVLSDLVETPSNFLSGSRLGFCEILPIRKSNTLPYSVTVIVDDSREALGSSQEYGYFRHVLVHWLWRPQYRFFRRMSIYNIT
ncbi:hypothetical protein TIFTF001_022140 [Ficus carica]|uniref:Ankyrin repeat protein n=1 Tax=Ficus carica TaxID=3494 RepID=A0AA88AZC5_FICCA|nr:hypothetical protein TIFTF001_022140 [Ficus carica]